ncbi:hypothetical protein [Spiroplasma endosymbiont of Polydrusus formosus]|uniref:hypothetical protein n=1 Tax=Spiroplasma endosymbiont of Polydrusus formosus TaxID=3139326 RepID=UPI0035B53213
MNAKYFMPSKFLVDKKYYVYYFIDKRMKGTFGYIHDKLSTENAIDAVKKAINCFKKIYFALT